MKKLVSYLLLLALTLSLFAGCSIVPSEDPTDPPVVNESYLENAKTILSQKYKPASKDEIPEKKKDFDLLTNIVVGGANHTVVWTIEITSGDASAIKLVAGTEKDYAQRVDVPDEPTEDILYTLTATISDYLGETVTVSFKFKTPAYSYDNLPTVKAPVAGTAYKLGLIQVNLGKALYLDGTCGERYLNTTEDKAASPDAYVEVVDGGFKLYILKDGAKNYIEYYTKKVDGEDKDCARFGETGSVFFYDSNNCSWTTTISVSDDGKAENRCLVAYNNYATVGASWSGHTTADNVGITQFPLGFFPVDSVEVPNIPENTDPEADTTLTIPAAIELGLSKVSGAYTTGKYYVVGEITEVYNTTYGNMKIKDAAGNILTIYGTYDATGANGYKDMSVKPVAGDTVKIYGIVGQYDGTAQIKNGWIVEHTPGTGSETPSEPTEPEATEPAATEPTTPAPSVTLENGSKIVIVCGAHNKALSSQPASSGSFYQLGVDVVIANGAVTGYADTEVWTVIAHADGTYSFAQGGQNLGMQASYSSMSLGAVNDKWELIPADNGTFVIKNVVRGNCIEWYASKNNWSTYTTSSLSDPLFNMSIFVVEGGSAQPPVTEPEATEPAPTEPEVTEPEVTEPEATQPSTDGAKGSADFGTFDVTQPSGGDSSYTNAHTTANGWTTANSAIQAGGVSDSNPVFKVFGPDKTYKAVCLNGKVSAPGKLTSPTLTGGINKLTFNYTKCFTDTKLGVIVTITDLATGTTYEKTLEASPANKFDVGEFVWELDTAISGDFTIEIVNSCPTANTGNKDRISIWNLNWY